MILIIEIIVQSIVYTTISGIMAYNNISVETKSYWSVLALTAFIYIFGVVMGKFYMV